MKQNKHNWCWVVGKVDTCEDHIEIHFGSADDSDWNKWKLIARIAAPRGQKFTVEFLVTAEDPDATEMLNAVKRELNFYLIEKGERNPWAYARYHCGTAANIYSKVHWSFIGKEA